MLHFQQSKGSENFVVLSDSGILSQDRFNLIFEPFPKFTIFKFQNFHSFRSISDSKILVDEGYRNTNIQKSVKSFGLIRIKSFFVK